MVAMPIKDFTSLGLKPVTVKVNKIVENKIYFDFLKGDLFYTVPHINPIFVWHRTRREYVPRLG